MPYQIDDTHDPKLQSWIESANDPATDFPIQNLPFARLVLTDDEDSAEDDGFVVSVVAIGDQVLILDVVAQEGFFEGIFDAELLEVLMIDEIYSTLAQADRAKFRARLVSLLSTSNNELKDHEIAEHVLLPIAEVNLPGVSGRRAHRDISDQDPSLACSDIPHHHQRQPDAVPLADPDHRNLSHRVYFAEPV